LLQNWDVTVVGVAKTVKFNTLGEPPTPVVYYPMKQHYSANVMLYVKTKGDPNGALSSVRSTVQSLDSALQLRNVGTVQQRMKNSLQGATLLAELLGSFGVLALLLAALGTYGVMAYSVSQRTQEIGIRMALGAQPGSVLGLILGSGMAMVGAGVIVGLGFGIVLTRSMNTLLYGIGNLDLATFGATSAILLAVAFLACYLPARRAMRVDPLVALRYE
jgi:putative ABC transport system permease protein